MTMNPVWPVAAAQMISGPDVEANLKEAERLIAEAADQGARLVALPEYFPSSAPTSRPRCAFVSCALAAPSRIFWPMRPAGTEGWSEEKLASIVSRDSMIGTGLPRVEDAA